MREREGNFPFYEIESLRLDFQVDKPRNSQNTKLETIRVDIELEPLRVEFQVDSMWKKAKSELGNQDFKARVLRGKSSL